MNEPTIRFPFGDADTFALTETGAQAITVDNNMTIIDGVAVPGTGDRTINLTIGDQVQAGSRILVKAETTGAHNTIFGTGFSGANNITGADGVTYNQEFVYDGTNFIPVAISNAQGAAIIALTATGAQAVTISSDKTVIDGVTTPGTADRTLNLTIGAGVLPGARMLVKHKETGATYHLIAGTGMIAADIVGVDGKTKTQAFTFDGVHFVPDGASTQID